jgi:hypothetical protein
VVLFPRDEQYPDDADEATQAANRKSGDWPSTLERKKKRWGRENQNICFFNKQRTRGTGRTMRHSVGSATEFRLRVALSGSFQDVLTQRGGDKPHVYQPGEEGGAEVSELRDLAKFAQHLMHH